MALPAKLGLMILKVGVKPFANALKERAATNEAFAKTCASLGRRATRMTAYLKIRAAGHEPKVIKDTLSNKAAVKRGSEVIAELLIFSIVGTATVGVFSQKSYQEEIEKKEKEERLDARFRALSESVDKLQQQINELSNTLEDTKAKVSVEKLKKGGNVLSVSRATKEIEDNRSMLNSKFYFWWDDAYALMCSRINGLVYSCGQMLMQWYRY